MIGLRPDISTLTKQTWDLVVIGGGITGAGILLEAARNGYKVLLIEQRDFAWGTSSRSSKMVHGGIRYLAQGHVQLTKESLQERERLIKELPNLVIRQPYHFLVCKGQWPNRFAFKMLMWMYDRLAKIKDHRWNNKKKLVNKFPSLAPAKLKGAMTYTDALTDDSRLVMRTLAEAKIYGAVACNYLSAQNIYIHNSQQATVDVKDELTQTTYTLNSRKIIHATGAWADRLSGSASKVRPLRGSHLFIDQERLPIDECLTVFHPKDKRPVFIYPWQGRTCVGTTDLDHSTDLNTEAHCTVQESDYLLALVNYAFPNANINYTDIIATIAGVRPTISAGKGKDPSEVRRDHLIWNQDGLINVSGGKLTTFRVIALDALKAARLLTAKQYDQQLHSTSPCFSALANLPDEVKYLGHPTKALAQGENLLKQIRWIVRHEMVIHLDDLLLRRIRFGLLMREGGKELLFNFKNILQEELAWSDTQWQQEVSRYLTIIEKYYAVPIK